MSYPYSSYDGSPDPTRPVEDPAENPPAPSGPIQGSPFARPEHAAGAGPQDVRPSGAPAGTGNATSYGAPPAWTSTPSPGFGVPPVAPVSSTERSMAMLAHLSLLLAWLLSAGWLTFVGPLVLWLVYKDKSPFVRQAAAGSFNFALTATLASIAAWAAFATVVGIVVAIPLWIAVFICSIVFPIMGAMKADKLQPYHYPMAIPVLS